MLKAHLGADKPAETEPSCPEDGGARPHPETAAGCSPEDGRAEDMLRLQQEFSGLREEFRRQEARWAATHRELRAQMDALVKQNLELWARLRASERRRLEAKRSAAGSVHVRRCSDTQVSESTVGKTSPLPADAGITPKHAGRSHSAALLGLPSGKPISRETEKTDSGKPIPCEDGDKTLSRNLQDRHAKPPEREQASEERPALSEDAKVLQQSPQSLQKWSGRRSPAPAALEVAPQDHRAKDNPDTRSLPSGRDAGRPRARTPMDEPMCPSPGISEEPQDLPVEPESPPHASQHEDTEIKQEEEGEVQHPEDKTHSAGAQTVRTAHRRPLEVGRVPNKQTEKVCSDGSKEITFPDGTVWRLNDGREETVFPDGTIVSVERNGDKTIVLSNGQREIHTAQFKRREYPDGTTRTVYHDCHQETKDASGRLKVRDEAGNIILDRK
nr:T-complex protein 10A homolog 2-like isoform X2 [Odocoileus virginianus texanus]XP_020741618.1 T-complex protein 10A homolog 2-like isoform X2 [Odocoileus virginianus texanus]